MWFFDMILSYGNLLFSQGILGPPCVESSTKLGTRILTSDVDAFINDLLADWNSPGGVSVAVVQKNEDESWHVETKGYGIAKADGSHVTEHTQFPIGSNSKLFTILATGLLISNESLSPRIDWNTKVKSIIPDWELIDPVASSDSNIIDLMSHRTGVPRHDFSYSLEDEVPDVIKRLRYLRPSVGFREKWQYNNMMYTLLSHLPTLVLPNNPQFARYVKQNIFDPLNLNATTYSYDVAKNSGNFADGFVRQHKNLSGSPFESGIPRVLPYWSQPGGEDGNVNSGAGGIISSAVDMATWLQTLLLDGRHPSTNNTVIPVEAIKTVSTGYTVSTGSASQPFLSPVIYGGGLFLNSYRGHVIVEHTGSVPGYQSAIARLPFDGLGVAVMSNDDTLGGYISLAIKWRVIDQALRLKPIDYKSITAEMVKKTYSSTPTPIPRPKNATLPSEGIAHLAGAYGDLGYGRIELCLASPKNATIAAPLRFCRDLMSNITTILPDAIDFETDVPTFLIKWNKLLSSYIRLTHFNGNLFNLTMLQSQPTGNSSKPFWTFEIFEASGAVAEFAYDHGSLGFGVRGVWGPGEGVQGSRGGSVKERAEIWFVKAE